MKTTIAIGVCASTLMLSAWALADDKGACMDAASKGQTLRDAHKLIEARMQFRMCARQQCPGVVQKDCAQWLDEVEKNVPTVVVSAKDDAGADLVEVKVTVDGQPLRAKLNGEALAMNPGPHSFHFELADGTSVDEQVLVREGEKNQNVTWAQKRAERAAAPTTAPPAAALPATTAVPTDAIATTPDVAGLKDGASAGRQGSPWTTIGYVAGGAGIIGLGVGTFFGVQAMSNKNSANCVNNYCDPGPLSDARNAATLSTVGFVAGGALLAVGAAAVLLAPNGSDEKAAMASVRAGPWAASNGGGLVVRGRW